MRITKFIKIQPIYTVEGFRLRNITGQPLAVPLDVWALASPLQRYVRDEHLSHQTCLGGSEGISSNENNYNPALVCLRILTWNCASRHKSVQLFISHLATWLRTRRFSEPTWRPSGATNHWKTSCFATFLPFSRAWIFFLLRLSLFWSSFFFSSLLWLFPSLLFICPYCRKFDF